jgi:hypothetical protein
VNAGKPKPPPKAEAEVAATPETPEA